MSTFLTPKAITRFDYEIIHFKSYAFDKLTITMYGHSNADFTAGIVMQEIKDRGFFSEWTQAASRGTFPVAISLGLHVR